MNRPLLLLLCTSFAAAGFSQTVLPKLSVAGKKPDTSIRAGAYGMDISGTAPNDTLLLRIMEHSRRKPSNGNMPNALAVPGPPDVYVGNNGKGHNIYRAQIDNMPVLKPDSTFSSNMQSYTIKPAQRSHTIEGVRPDRLPRKLNTSLIIPKKK